VKVLNDCEGRPYFCVSRSEAWQVAQTGGRIEVALAQCAGVHAGVELGGDLVVALGAGGGYVEAVHACAGRHGAVHVMRAVAINTVGGLGLAGRERRAVHTLVKRGDEFRAAQGMTGDVLLADVTGFTLPGLGEFLPKGRLCRRDGDDRLAVAGEAIGGVGLLRAEGAAVGRGGEMVACLRMALAAGVGLRPVVEGESRALHGRDGVRAVAGGARGVLAVRQGSLREPRVKGVLRPGLLVAGDAVDGLDDLEVRRAFAVKILMAVRAVERAVHGLGGQLFVDEERDLAAGFDTRGRRRWSRLPAPPVPQTRAS
jgi:hypothetical protein